MAAAGGSMRTLQEWMGHRDIATTQRYADYARARERRSLWRQRSSERRSAKTLPPPRVVVATKSVKSMSSHCHTTTAIRANCGWIQAAKDALTPLRVMPGNRAWGRG
jgi:hypothetical protein